jgi:putative transposase
MEIAMVDEIETGVSSAAVTTDKPAEMPVAKKQRAPRRSKAEIEAALSGPKSAATVKSPVIRKKRATQAAPVAVETPDTGKTTTKGRGKNTGNGKPANHGVVTAAVSATDEMADLIQLEAENKRLRLALAEKLRAENADLRKRLGA